MDNSNQSDSQDNGVFSFNSDGSIVDSSQVIAQASEESDIAVPGDPTSTATIRPASPDTIAEDPPQTGLLSTNTEQHVLSSVDDRSSSATAPEEVSQSGGTSTTATNGATTVDVSVGGGMIEVISKAKGISLAEAEQVYYTMKAKGQIHGIPGTYDMTNHDIGISAPGPFVIGQDLMADIDAAAGVAQRPEQETTDVLGQTDRPQEMNNAASGAQAESPVDDIARPGIGVDSAPRSIIDTRIAPFPTSPRDI